ncbi:hypothetical protein MP638_003521, partial [Amoeboaphelidium occidentale]
MIILVWITLAILVAGNSDNSLAKYLTAKKPSFQINELYKHGMYENLLIGSIAGNIYMVDIDTGILVKTITASFTSTGGTGIMSSVQVIGKHLIIFYSDSAIQQWNLDTGEIVREIKPSRSSILSGECVWHFDLDLVFCSLANGFVRKINMATKRIETEFDAHDNYCNVLVNGSLLYTASFDGLVKKFDLFGNLLRTYEVALGYANLAAFEGDYLFVYYYNIEFDRKVRIVRWNHITGIPEEFPVPVSYILDPVRASKDSYICFGLGSLGLNFIQLSKSDLSIIRSDLRDQLHSFAAPYFSNGERFFFLPNSTIYEINISSEGVNLRNTLDVEVFSFPFADLVVINDTTVLVVFSQSSSVNFQAKFLDTRSGIFSDGIEIFNDHHQFQKSGDVLIAAVGQKVAAYNIADLTLLWKSPTIAPQTITTLRYQEGLIYFTTLNYAGCYNASTFEKIGLLYFDDGLYGTPAFLDQVFYRLYTEFSMFAYDFTDGRMLIKYDRMPNFFIHALIYEGYLYVANTDSFIYKYDISSPDIVLVFSGHTFEVSVILIDGLFMYSGSADQKIRKWNIENGESLFIYHGHSERIDKLYLHDRKLFSLTRTEIKIWDLTRDRLLATQFEKSSVLISLSVFQNGLFSCSVDGTITSWNIDQGRKYSELKKKTPGKFFVTVQSLNNSLAVSYNDGSIVQYFLEENATSKIISNPAVVELSNFVLFKDLLFLFGAAEGLAIKNLTSDIVRRIEIKNYVSNSLLVTDQFIFSGNNDTSITKYDASSLGLLRTIKAHTGSVTVLGQFENELISGSEDNSLRTWNLDNLNLISDL